VQRFLDEKDWRFVSNCADVTLPVECGYSSTGYHG